MKLLNLWAGLSLVVSGLVLFLFSNLLIYNKVRFYENMKAVLLFEYLVAVFVFAISLYVAYFLLIKKGYSLELRKKKLIL